MKKITRIEVQRFKAARNITGSVEIGFDALFVQQFPPEDREPMHVLSMNEADARSLFLLLKSQLADLDKRKARSQR